MEKKGSIIFLLRIDKHIINLVEKSPRWYKSLTLPVFLNPVIEIEDNI